MCNGYNPVDNLEEIFETEELKFWKVDNEGNITFLPDNCVYYTSDELESENLLNHILTKAGMHKGGYEAQCEFYKAYMRALENAGVKSITIDVEHPMTLIK